jgi:hypothetical protein
MHPCFKESSIGENMVAPRPKVLAPLSDRRQPFSERLMNDEEEASVEGAVDLVEEVVVVAGVMVVLAVEEAFHLVGGVAVALEEELVLVSVAAEVLLLLVLLVDTMELLDSMVPVKDSYCLSLPRFSRAFMHQVLTWLGT